MTADEEDEYLSEDGILWATTNEKYDLVKEILEKDPESVNLFDSDGYKPLHKAAYNNSYDLAKLLLQFKADPNAKTEFKWTPLHSACKWNHSRTAALLLQHNSDINALTEGQQTPLHIGATVSNCRETMVTLLMNPNINPNILNNSHEKAEEIAKRTGLTYPIFKMANTAFQVETGIIE